MFKLIGATVVYGLAMFGLARLLQITSVDADAR
jgi:DNA polymerase I-like protein with 3'-5' exonuclease and polymerase domains